jgi:transposase InsO family protein
MRRRPRHKKNKAIRMLLERVEAIRTEVGESRREVLEAAGLPCATYHRWTARLRDEEPFVEMPGPKKEVQLDLEDLLAEVRRMKHRRRRSFGTTELYEAHREEISRRQLQGLVKVERCRVNAERRAYLRRITWRVPGLTWAMDGTRIGPVQLQQVQDLASRYKYEPFLAASLSGEQVAEHLERIIAVHGAPLVLKRDRGSNLRDDAVQAVLERHLIIPLDSPRRYPQYNGAIEYAQREMKDLLEVRYPLADQALANYAAAAQELNHRRRPCLDGATACAVLETGRQAMKSYTRPKRKEIIDWIRNEALDIIHKDGLSGADARDAAWRRAVESWLHRNGVITVSVDGKVLPCFP